MGAEVPNHGDDFAAFTTLHDDSRPLRLRRRRRDRLGLKGRAVAVRLRLAASLAGGRPIPRRAFEEPAAAHREEDCNVFTVDNQVTGEPSYLFVSDVKNIWINGNPSTWRYWGPGQPDLPASEHCGEVWSDNKFNNHVCSHQSKNSACQISKTGNSAMLCPQCLHNATFSCRAVSFWLELQP